MWDIHYTGCMIEMLGVVNINVYDVIIMKLFDVCNIIVYEHMMKSELSVEKRRITLDTSFPSLQE